MAFRMRFLFVFSPEVTRIIIYYEQLINQRLLQSIFKASSYFLFNFIFVQNKNSKIQKENSYSSVAFWTHLKRKQSNNDDKYCLQKLYMQQCYNMLYITNTILVMPMLLICICKLSIQCTNFSK